MIRIIMIFAMLFALTACSKLTRENYDKIKVGMELAEVENIIGTADACDEALGTKSCTWGNKEKNIKIKFVADKVVLPSANGL